MNEPPIFARADLPRVVRALLMLSIGIGFFIASTDYWPDKVDTSDTKLYDMTWTIFSRDEIKAFFDVARGKGLHPIGDFSFEATEAMIHVKGKRYTFGWLAMEKR